ncbi:hypothetical protein PV783_24500 [Chitinophaga sp. CC14]|uniref:hypothetical protein n=1 Tax=Chitinophaga sp. CC14 TaxID=3029199 RepID=UPI003B7B3EB2
MKKKILIQRRTFAEDEEIEVTELDAAAKGFDREELIFLNFIAELILEIILTEHNELDD